MSLTAGKTKAALTGQAQVDLLIEGLIELLEGRPGRSITGTKSEICELATAGSPALAEVCGSLAKQLCMAINAKHRTALGLSVEPLGDGKVRVMLV